MRLVLSLFCSAIFIAPTRVNSSERVQNIFQILSQDRWLDQDRKLISLDGKKSPAYYGFVLSFTNCKTLCPMIAHDLKAISKKIDSMKIYLVSIKPQEDSFESLKRYLQKHNLSEQRFEFIKNDKEKTERLSKLLGLRFSDTEIDGHTDHSTSLVIFNSEGVKRTSYDLTNGINEKKIEELEKLLK